MLLIVICAAIAFVLLALLGLVHFTRARSEELTASLTRSDAGGRTHRRRATR